VIVFKSSGGGEIVMGEKKYIVKKSFNNNVVLCADVKTKKECVLVGKGIGFGVKAGRVLKSIESVEKKFCLQDRDNKNDFNNLTMEIESSIVGITEEIIAMLSDEISSSLNEKIHVTLLDHIAFAVKRIESNIEIKNPFLFEIRFLYKDEFLLAEKVIDKINKTLNVNLPMDEAAFIAMHINAAINSEDICKISMNTDIITEMIQLIENKIDEKIDKYSIEYGRMVTHLRFAIDRTQKNISIENLLLSNIKENYKQAYDISKELAEKINKDFGLQFPEGEIGYIAIHLQNIFNKMNINNACYVDMS
jgi:transcriptional antiterminator